MTKADRQRARKCRLIAAGYSAVVATAAARIDDDPIRDAILGTLGGSGIADGRPRAYLIGLIAARLKAGAYPSAPANMAGAEARLIEARATELADTVYDLARR